MINAEKLVIAHINKNPDLPRAFGRVPENRPTRFITVERTGGASGKIFDRPILAIQVWADSNVHASELAYELKEYLLGLREHAQVGGVEVNALYHWPDPDSKHERYQIVLALQTQ